MDKQNLKNIEIAFKVSDIQEDKFEEDLSLLSKTTDNFESLQIANQKSKRCPKKTKTIQRTRTRTMKSNSKWIYSERISYFKSLIKFNISKTSIGISWTYWKPERLFNYISDEIKTKNKDQVKSFDERMKKQYLGGKNIDLIPAAIMQLQSVKQTDDQAKELLASHQKLQKQSSEYMRTIKKKISLISEVDHLIQDLKKQMSMYQRKSSKDEIFLDQE